MDVDALLTGGAGAGTVWLVLRVVGRWVATQRWVSTIEAESLATISREREALRLRVHELELRCSAAEAVAKQCRSHMDTRLFGAKQETDNESGTSTNDSD